MFVFLSSAASSSTSLSQSSLSFLLKNDVATAPAVPDWFWINSPDMVTSDNEMLPFANTCLAEGGGVSPALSWGGAPSGTRQYMITMSSHSDNPDTSSCSRYEWVLYGIDASVTSIAAGNPDGIGKPGGSFPGAPKYEYAVPCPSGSGFKTYYITVYALTGDLTGSVTDDYYRCAPLSPPTSPLSMWLLYGPSLAPSPHNYSKVGPELLLEANSQNMVAASAQFTAKVCFTGCVETNSEGLPEVVVNTDDDGECI